MVELAVVIDFVMKTSSYLNMSKHYYQHTPKNVLLSISVNKLNLSVSSAHDSLDNMWGTSLGQCKAFCRAASATSNRKEHALHKTALVMKLILWSKCSCCENLCVGESVEGNSHFVDRIAPAAGQRAVAEVSWYPFIACWLAEPGVLWLGYHPHPAWRPVTELHGSISQCTSCSKRLTAFCLGISGWWLQCESIGSFTCSGLSILLVPILYVSPQVMVLLICPPLPSACSLYVFSERQVSSLQGAWSSGTDLVTPFPEKGFQSPSWRTCR